MITQDQLKSLYDYESGRLVHRTSGQVFGCRRGAYIKGNIDGVTYFEHRLIFLWHHGYMPDITDHKNGDHLDNRIENLRAVTQSQNMGNSHCSPMRGIEKHGRKYRVRIIGEGWRKELGSFNTLEEAVQARNEGHVAHFGQFSFYAREV
jgi:hypothetical protein